MLYASYTTLDHSGCQHWLCMTIAWGAFKKTPGLKPAAQSGDTISLGRSSASELYFKSSKVILSRVQHCFLHALNLKTRVS